MPWRCDQQLFTRPTPACVCLQCLENPCTQDLFCTLPVALCHDHEESLCPCRRGRYADPFSPMDQSVAFHRPEPGENIVMRDAEKFSKFSGCGKTYGDAGWRKTEGYAPIHFQEDLDRRLEDIVMFICGHPIIGVLGVRWKKGVVLITPPLSSSRPALLRASPRGRRSQPRHPLQSVRVRPS